MVHITAHTKVHILYLQAFLGAVFDTLLYQLTDSLQRLSSVKKLEVAKEDSRLCYCNSLLSKVAQIF